MIPFLLAAALANGPPRNGLVELDQRQLNAISAKCGTPRAWLRKREGALHVHPGPTAKYEQVDCVLVELRRRHSGPIAIIGNEVAQ